MNLSMGKIDLFEFKLCANKWLMLNWTIRNMFDNLTVGKQMTDV